MGDRIDVIDPAIARVVAQLVVPTDSTHVALEITPSGLVVASGDEQLVALDPVDGIVRWSHAFHAPYPGVCPAIAVSELAGAVYCSGMFGRIREYDLAEGTPVGRSKDVLFGTVGPLAVSRDGTALTAIGGSDPVISRWRLDGSGLTNRLVGRGSFAIAGYEPAGTELLIAPRDKSPGEGGIQQDVSLLDTATGRIIRTFETPMAEAAWAGKGRLAAYIEPDEDRGMRLFDATEEPATGMLLHRAERIWVTDNGDRLNVYAFGKIIARDPQTGSRVAPAISIDGYAVALIGSPNGREIAVSSLIEGRRTLVSIFDAATGDLKRSDDLIAPAAVLLDDGQIVIADDNRLVRWDSTTTPFTMTGTLSGSAGGFGIPTLSDDGRTWLMTSASGSEMLYDMPSGVRIGDPFEADTPNLNGAHLRSDGRELAVNVADGIMLWDLDPEHQFTAVCRIAGRDLTAHEWSTYLPGLGEPRSTCG
ncbi:PQQ-like beta-propeller repeat protein [Agromyces sp. SYSU K20354]|uniref:PQQ-like beta-propeller repeat protein n=1 Tax=Agromyces cavernae TaxID=2898659 RepID=UPI001E41AE0B|nr:PQQ-like beta-propeller repeat protein [Agromyces cavernae]MCD2442547.1 PQQ-like beta-propeller repeat protein [Agromyces cavernae]